MYYIPLYVVKRTSSFKVACDSWIPVVKKILVPVKKLTKIPIQRAEFHPLIL